MGVTGLWQLLSPIGKPIPLETLENKILAIDISIWLNQAVKGFRDAQGGAQPNAHLLGLFHRVCKLLFFKIKPVFVFDGAAPLLKRQTLESRRRNRQANINSAEKTSQQILTNLMARELLDEASSSGNTKSKRYSPQKRSKIVKVNPADDIFWLPPLPENSSFSGENKSSDTPTSLADVDDDDGITMALDSIFEREYQNLNEVDIESEEFNNLPPNIRHEILTEMKERKRQQFYRQHEMPRESHIFSDYQMSRLLKRRQLTKKLDEVKNELNSHAAGELMSNLEGELAAMQKIASEDNTHTVFIQTSNKRARLSNNEVLAKAVLNSEEKTARVIIPNETIIDEDSIDDNPDSPTVCEMDTVENQMVLQKIIQDSVANEKRVNSSDQDGIVIISEGTSNESKSPMFAQQKKIPDVEVTKSSKQEQKVIDLTKEELTLDVSEKRKLNEVLTDDDTIDNVESPLPVAKEDIQKLDETEYIIDDSSDGECNSSPVKKCDDEVKTTSKSPLKPLTIVLDISKLPSKNDDELFPSEIFSTVAGPSKVTISETNESNSEKMKMNVSDQMKILKKFFAAQDNASEDGNKNESTVSNNDLTAVISATIESKLNDKSTVMNDDLTETFNAAIEEKLKEDEIRAKSISIEQVALDIDKDDKTQRKSTSEDVQPPSQRSHVIEDFLTSKLTPNSGLIRHNSKSDSSSKESLPIKETHSSEAVSVLADMTEQNLNELRDELDSERLEFVREQKKKERQAQTMSDQIILESQELLKLFGVPFIVSPTEAEAQCAQLEHLGLTHGTITDDSDIWLFGGSKVFKNFFTQGKFLESYNNKDIESHFGLDRTQLICFALLTGSDYTEGVEGVGPVRAMEVISEFKKDGFETLKSFRDWYDLCHKSAQAPGNKVRAKLLKLELPDNFPVLQVYEAYVKPHVDESNEKFSWGLPNLAELRQLSKDKFGWTREKVDEILLPVMKKVSERQSQLRIDSFYQVTITQKPKNLFPSKRIQSALTKIKPGTNSELIDDPGACSSKNTRKPKKGSQTQKRGAKNAAPGKTAKKINREINLSEESSSDDCVEINPSLSNASTSKSGVGTRTNAKSQDTKVNSNKSRTATRKK